MAVSEMRYIQTTLGKAQVFANDSRTVRFRMNQRDSESVAVVNRVAYEIDMCFTVQDDGTVKNTTHYSSRDIRRSGSWDLRNELPSDSARKKIQAAVLETVNSWVKLPNTQQLLRDTEVECYSYKLKHLRAEQAKLLSKIAELEEEARQTEAEPNTYLKATAS